MIKKLFALMAFAVLLVAQVDRSAANETGVASQPEPASWAEVDLPSLTLDLALPNAPADRVAINPKLDDALSDLAAAPLATRSSAAEAGGLRLEAGLVQTQLIIALEDEAAVRQAVAEAGGEVTGAFEGVAQAWLPADQLAALSALPTIDYIRVPDTAVPADEEALAAVTEGLAAAKATTWLDAGWRGRGVRVAIIDGGFLGYKAKLGGELPLQVTVKNFVDGQTDAQVDGPTPHGTACVEIVHDMAPGAELYLLKISTDVDLNEAVEYAIGQGVDIISTSLTFVNVTPGDGTGRFAAMAQKVRSLGILWVTAAGNYRETHWSGSFVDNDGDGLHEFAGQPQVVEVNVFGAGNGTAFLIPAGVSISPSIRWSDWAVVNQDLRLLLLRHNGTSFEIVASIDNPQTNEPGQRPTERLSYITNGPAAVYGVAIQRVSLTRNVHLHLLTPNREMDRRMPAMSLGNLADVASILTVAAVNVNAPFVREEYSSEGPTNGTGGSPAGGRIKPDLAAFANVSTASYGPRAFNGTSAATPHVAGAAALLLNAYPTALPGEIQDYLQANAADQGLTGRDNQFGYGRLLLGAPPGPSAYDYHSFVPHVATIP